MPNLVYRKTKGANLNPDEMDANFGALNLAVETALGRSSVHPYYFFHGFAGGQLPDDAQLTDISGAGNHAAKGNHLGLPVLWETNPGYATTILPISGSTNSVLRMPPINFDYLSGEKLFIWSLGKWSPAGSHQPIMGDGSNTTPTNLRGWAVRAMSTGHVQMVLYGATVGFGGSGSLIPFNGALHDFGIVLDGAARKYCQWVDGTMDPNFAGYMPFASSAAIDTKGINTVNIGSSSPAPGTDSGLATATRALVILRFPADYPAPPISALTAVIRQLRDTPGNLVLAGAV